MLKAKESSKVEYQSSKEGIIESLSMVEKILKKIDFFFM